jgi:hypothetical protein
LAYSKRKYGIESHIKEILEFCEDKDSLYKREAELVNEQVLADPMNMNLRLGGNGGWDCAYINSSRSLAAKKALDTRRKNGFSISPVFTTEQRAIMHNKSVNTLKKRYSDGNIVPPFLGKKHSDSSKVKIGMANSVSQSGSKNSQFGTTWIYSLDLKECMKIKKDDLELFLEQGWTKGRKTFVDD